MPERATPGPAEQLCFSPSSAESMHLRPLQARQLAIPPRLQCRQLAQPTPPMPLPPPVRSISAIAVPDDAQRQAETQVSREWIEVLGRCARKAPIHLAISGLRRQCAGPSDHRPAPTTKFHRKSGIDRGSSHDLFFFFGGGGLRRS
jgi:hypothetical protein